MTSNAGTTTVVNPDGPVVLGAEARAFLEVLEARHVAYRVTAKGFMTPAKLSDEEAIALGALLTELEAFLGRRPVCADCGGSIRSTVEEVLWMDHDVPRALAYHPRCRPALTPAAEATRHDLNPRQDLVTFWQGPARCILCLGMADVATIPDAPPVYCRACFAAGRRRKAA